MQNRMLWGGGLKLPKIIPKSLFLEGDYDE